MIVNDVALLIISSDTAVIQQGPVCGNIACVSYMQSTAELKWTVLFWFHYGRPM